jgi:hypothetical protein
MFPQTIVRPKDKQGELSNPLKPVMIVAVVGITLDIPELFTIDRRAIFIPIIRGALNILFLVFLYRKSMFAWHWGLMSFAAAVVLEICGYAMGVKHFGFTTFSSIAWPTAVIITFLWLLALRKPYTDFLNSRAAHIVGR